MFKMKKNVKKAKDHPVYEVMMEELMNTYVGVDVLKQAFDWKDLNKKSLPVRYRIIALGLMKQDALEDVNDNLINNGCQPLYSRSSFEATLIYAFANQLSYREWKKIALACEQAKNHWKENLDANDDYGFFQGKKITFGDLENYVLAFSERHDQELVTKQFTHALDQSIRSLGKDYAEFFRFYVNNLQIFSDVREKSRYYFCKYLYYYLLSKIARYQAEVGDSIPAQEQLMELLPLKVESKLRRRKTNPDDLMDILRSCTISPAAIFEEFNYYFFEYVSLDWVELMLENVNDIDDLDASQIAMVAEYLRSNASKKELAQMGNDTDKELVQKRIHALQNGEMGTHTSRKGENAIRKYLRGDLDIDRTTLICFLLFWGSKETNRNEIEISEERINTILDECGFSMLRRKEPFDNFVLQYMQSDDPVSYLMEEMDKYLSRGEPFFVYEVYSRSGSNAKEIRKQLFL